MFYVVIRRLVAVVAAALFHCTLTAEEFSPAVPMPLLKLDSSSVVTRFVFGSCANPALDQEIFAALASQKPDVFLLTGDNVYAKSEKDDPALTSLREAYAGFAASLPFASLRRTVPTLVTWDDHDYGLNDAGGDWPHKAASQALYNHVWQVDDERLARDGVHYARIAGPEGRRVQFILLDTRYFRSPLKRADKKQAFGRYTANTDADATVLGEAQWRWLKEQLLQPAELRIIASSIQVIPTGHNFEAWHLFPRERQRLYDLIHDTRADGVVLLSGDRHSAAIYRHDSAISYPLWEVTSSSLNVPLTSFVKNIKVEPGEYRVGLPYYDANFGQIDIDWPAQRIIMQVRDEQGRTVLAASVAMSALKAAP